MQTSLRDYSGEHLWYLVVHEMTSGFDWDLVIAGKKELLRRGDKHAENIPDYGKAAA